MSEIDEFLRRFRHGTGRLTPTRILHLKALLLFGGEATVKEVAESLDRRADNVRRQLRYLRERRVVEEIGKDRYRVVGVGDLVAALKQGFIKDGIPEVERAQRLRDERDRESYAIYLRLKEAAKRGEDLEQVTPPARIVDLSSRIIDSTEQVYAPTVQQQREMVRNLPPVSADGIRHHGPECFCWLCGEDAPEYVPVDASLALAGVA